MCEFVCYFVYVIECVTCEDWRNVRVVIVMDDVALNITTPLLHTVPGTGGL